LNDDIVLPGTGFFDTILADGGALPELNSSSYVVNNTNNENFFGTTTAHAITGRNTATTTGVGHGEIFTGNADSYQTAILSRIKLGWAVAPYILRFVYGEIGQEQLRGFQQV